MTFNNMKVLKIRTTTTVAISILLFVTRTALALDNEVDATLVVSAQRGSCRASGLCCQIKNNTCRGVVQDADKKHYSPRCFCDTACLDIGDCCDDYVQSCQPVDCVLASDWDEWSECDTRCGPGTKQRRRQVLQPALNGGAACGPTLQKIPCEGSNCKVARAPDGFHELREIGYIIPAVFGTWRKSNRLGYNPFRDIRRNIFKHYDAHSVIQRPAYCMTFELTGVRAGCNVTGTPAEAAFTDQLVKGATVCVECQSAAMKRQLGTRCRGHGVARKQTRWKAVTLPGCRGRWVLKSRQDDCHCSVDSATSFILV